MSNTFKMIMFTSGGSIEEANSNPNPYKELFKDFKDKKFVPKPETELDYEKKMRDGRNRLIIYKDYLFQHNEELEGLNLISQPESAKKMLKEKPWLQRNVMKKSNRIEKWFHEVNKPITISKAESMMQKMGWDGGALGKTGSGIKEPVTPNLAYCMDTKGFGQEIVQPASKKKKRGNSREKLNKKLLRKMEQQDFKINVLRAILDFVRNEKQVELLFDCQLNNFDRKNIHHLMEAIREVETFSDAKLKDESAMFLELIFKITKYNRYVLLTQSEGIMPFRYLCLYKEAPSFMYLVTHLDLRGEARIVKKTPRYKFQKKNRIVKRKNMHLQNKLEIVGKNDVIDETVLWLFEDSPKKDKKAVESDTNDGKHKQGDETKDDGDCIVVEDYDIAEVNKKADGIKSDDKTAEKMQDDEITDKLETNIPSNDATTNKLDEKIVKTEVVKDASIVENIKSVDVIVETHQLDENLVVDETAKDTCKSENNEEKDLTRETLNFNENQIESEVVKDTITIGNKRDDIVVQTTEVTNNNDILKTENAQNNADDGIEVLIEESKLDTVNKTESKMEIDCETVNIDDTDQNRSARDVIWYQRKDSNDESDDDIIVVSDEEDDLENLNENPVAKKEKVRRKIMKYFADFTLSEQYTEFKFLGTFDDEEFEVVNEFLKKIWVYLSGALVDDEEFVDVMKNAEAEFVVQEDCNGGTVIIKLTNPQGEEPSFCT